MDVDALGKALRIYHYRELFVFYRLLKVDFFIRLKRHEFFFFAPKTHLSLLFEASLS